ncbi:4815_t:CDS:1, partial [Funneliformis geosporum]
LKTHISSRASYLSPADYKDIMQYRDMKSKPVTQLSKKYNISNSRLYQIWRGQEFNRIQWNDLAVTPSMNIMNKQNEERQ